MPGEQSPSTHCSGWGPGLVEWVGVEGRVPDLKGVGYRIPSLFKGSHEKWSLSGTHPGSQGRMVLEDHIYELKGGSKQDK